MGLHPGFVLETVLIIQGCFHYCWAALTQSQGLFLFITPPCQWAGWGCTRSQEGTQLGQLTPTDQRGILGILHSYMKSCPAINLGGRLERGHCSGTDWALVSWCWTTVFICITCLFLSLLFSFSLQFVLVIISVTKLFLSQPRNFLTFTLSILLFSHPAAGGGSKWAAEWCLVTSRG